MAAEEERDGREGLLLATVMEGEEEEMVAE